VSVVLGLDAAPTRTGVCVIAEHNGDVDYPFFDVVERIGRDDASLVSYCRRILELIFTGYSLDLVVLEDYTRQTQSMVAFDAGEVGGILRFNLAASAIPPALLIVHPSVLRSFIANGRPLPKMKAKVSVIDATSGASVQVPKFGGKQAITHYVCQDFRIDLSGIPQKDASDIADACALAHFGRMYLDNRASALDYWGPRRLCLASETRLLKCPI